MPRAASQTTASRVARVEVRAERLPQDAAAAWVRDHRDAAVLAAFAIGVFIGAWMRG